MNNSQSIGSAAAPQPPLSTPVKQEEPSPAVQHDVTRMHGKHRSYAHQRMKEMEENQRKQQVEGETLPLPEDLTVVRKSALEKLQMVTGLGWGMVGGLLFLMFKDNILSFLQKFWSGTKKAAKELPEDPSAFMDL